MIRDIRKLACDLTYKKYFVVRVQNVSSRSRNLAIVATVVAFTPFPGSANLRFVRLSLVVLILAWREACLYSFARGQGPREASKFFRVPLVFSFWHFSAVPGWVWFASLLTSASFASFAPSTYTRLASLMIFGSLFVVRSVEMTCVNYFRKKIAGRMDRHVCVFCEYPLGGPRCTECGHHVLVSDSAE